jgi:hypothetical protein
MPLLRARINTNLGAHRPREFQTASHSRPGRRFSFSMSIRTGKPHVAYRTARLVVLGVLFL